MLIVHLFHPAIFFLFQIISIKVQYHYHQIVSQQSREMDETVGFPIQFPNLIQRTPNQTTDWTLVHAPLKVHIESHQPSSVIKFRSSPHHPSSGYHLYEGDLISNTL